MRILLNRLKHYTEVVLPHMAANYHWQVQGNFTFHIIAYLGYSTPRMDRRQIKQAIKVAESIIKHEKQIEEIAPCL